MKWELEGVPHKGKITTPNTVKRIFSTEVCNVLATSAHRTPSACATKAVDFGHLAFEPKLSFVPWRPWIKDSYRLWQLELPYTAFKTVLYCLLSAHAPGTVLADVARTLQTSVLYVSARRSGHSAIYTIANYRAWVFVYAGAKHVVWPLPKILFLRRSSTTKNTAAIYTPTGAVGSPFYSAICSTVVVGNTQECDNNITTML